MPKWKKLANDLRWGFYHLYGFFLDKDGWMAYRKEALHAFADEHGWAENIRQWLEERREKKERKRIEAITGSPVFEKELEYLVGQARTSIEQEAAFRYQREGRHLREAHSTEVAGLESQLTTQREENEVLTGEKAALASELGEARQELDEAEAEKRGLETQFYSLERKFGRKEKELKTREAAIARQGEVTEALYCKLILFERFPDVVDEPIVFVDRSLRILRANSAFTREFGYAPGDLFEQMDAVPGTPEGEVDYNRRGKFLTALVGNRDNLKKLHVLNEFFHPKSRQDSHYEICVSMKPKREQTRGLLSYLTFQQPGQYVPCMADTTVAIDKNGQFVGAALSFRRLSRSELKNIGVNYFLNRGDFAVTAGERVDMEAAEEYRKKVMTLYTHDLSSTKKARQESSGELRGDATIDFINTTSIDAKAAAVFREIYNFCCSKKGEHLGLSFINLRGAVRSELFGAGIPSEWLHAQQKIREGRPSYEAPLDESAAPETV